MLRTVNDGPTLWEAIIPQCLLGLPGDLAEIDELLDDPRFFEPFRAFFDPTRGRPSIPMETYLRMMFLKYRYRLGFEPLCVEVADSLAWRRFCRVPLDGSVPHPSTLMKITKRCGTEAIDGLNEALLAKAHEQKLVRLDRVRADTTVVEANVAYPTDSGLLAKGVAKLARLSAKVKATGLASRTTFRDRTRSVRRRAHDINAWLRRRSDDAKAEVAALNAEMVALAGRTVTDARHVAVNARRGLRGARGLATAKTLALLAELEATATLVERVAAQTRLRLAGQTPDGATRIVSLHDPDARPIVKGRLGKPVEFGYKAQVVDNVEGIVLDHEVHRGTPADAPMLVPAVARITVRFGKAPRTVTADRGYGEAAVDAGLEALGVKRVVIPRKGRPGAARQQVQRTRSFRRLVKWRTGSEARISCLKRDYGWRRTLTDGETGAATWCGWGVLAHNATKISALTREAERQRAGPGNLDERPETAAA
ncbi:MAG: ISNCY family transposase [Acidimicrobiia bacterium]